MHNKYILLRILRVDGVSYHAHAAHALRVIQAPCRACIGISDRCASSSRQGEFLSGSSIVGCISVDLYLNSEYWTKYWSTHLQYILIVISYTIALLQANRASTNSRRSSSVVMGSRGDHFCVGSSLRFNTVTVPLLNSKHQPSIQYPKYIY